MTPVMVHKAMQQLKSKNFDGPESIPQRIVVDGIEVLRQSF
jgi:hypothetical protein